jgi:hypothetical protein
LLTLSLAAAGLAGYWYLERSQGGNDPRAEASSRPAQATSRADSNEDDSQASQSATQPTPLPEPTEVSVVVNSSPPGASVYRTVDGVRLGETPYRSSYRRADGALELTLRLDGYQPEDIQLSTADDQETTVELDKLPAASKPRTPKRKRKRKRKRDSKPESKSGGSVPLGDKTINPFGK